PSLPGEDRSPLIGTGPVDARRTNACQPAKPGRNRCRAGAPPDPPRRSRDLGQLLLAPPLDRRTDADRLAIFGNRPAREVETLLPQELDELVVREDVVRILGIAQRADLRLDRFGRDRALPVRRGHAAGEEVFQLERTALAVQVLVRGHPA